MLGACWCRRAGVGAADVMAGVISSHIVSDIEACIALWYAVCIVSFRG